MATEQPVARLRGTDGSDHKRRIVIDFAARRSDLTPSEFLGNLIARVTMLDHLQLRAGAGTRTRAYIGAPGRPGTRASGLRRTLQTPALKAGRCLQFRRAARSCYSLNRAEADGRRPAACPRQGTRGGKPTARFRAGRQRSASAGSIARADRPIGKGERAGRRRICD